MAAPNSTMVRKLLPNSQSNQFERYAIHQLNNRIGIVRTRDHMSGKTKSATRLRIRNNPQNNLFSMHQVREAPFFSTSAEFLDPKAMQLHRAYSTSCLRPACGT